MENNYIMAKLYNAFMEAREEMNNNPNLQPVFSEGNTKTHIPSIDLLPIMTCHGRCHETCGKVKNNRKVPDCYACKGRNLFPSGLKNKAINTVLAIYKPDIFWKYVDNLSKVNRFIRYFVSGDMIIGGFFDRMIKNAKENPHCTFLAFTKCYEIVNKWIDQNGELPENMVILFSGWEGLKPDNPHNLPETTVYKNDNDFQPDKWLSCGGNCLNCACYGLGCWKAKKGDTVAFKKH